ncbi:MAG TPA: methyltransferase domain-containing protein [Candidatus Binataceae bacterium]
MAQEKRRKRPRRKPIMLGVSAAIAPAPDRAEAIEQYRSRVPVYDLEIALAEPIRRRAIERLGLKPGETVLDVGCGTGLSFPHIEQFIGPQGAIIGVEQSPDMIAKARARAEENDWANVTLINAPAEEASIERHADAAVFHFTHDLMQTPAALENALRSLKPGARVVATGLKWARWWSPGVNLFVRIAAMRSTTTMAGLEQPWRYLEPHLSGMVIETAAGGGTYLAYGVRK